MRSVFLLGFCLSVVAGSGCETEPAAPVAPRYSLAHDYVIPADPGIGVSHEGLTVGDGPQGQQVLYINYDGAVITKTNHTDLNADDATLDRSWILNVGAGSTATLPVFDTSMLQSPKTDAQIKDTITTQVVDWYAPYNVYVTTTRPTSGQYSMIMVGGQTANFVTGMNVEPSTIGVAGLDCGNGNQNNIGFVFSDDIHPQDTSSAAKDVAMLLIAQTIAHEAGHTFGLEHVYSPNPTSVDIMEPAVNPNVTGFLMGDQQLADSKTCPSTATLGTDMGMVPAEDTNMRLLANPGPAPAGGTTAVKPSVAWLAPTNGASMPYQFFMAVSASTTSGTITKVEIDAAGVVLHTMTTPPYQVLHQFDSSTPNGTPVHFTAVAYNSVGGKASAAIDFTIDSSATQGPIPCLVDADCDSGMCSSGMCVAACSPACGAGETCQAGVCTPSSDMGLPMSVEVGAACTDSSQCGTAGVCATTKGKQYCTHTCDPSSPSSCPSDYRCAAVGADHYCTPASSGCAAEGPLGASESRSLVWLVFAAGLITARRRLRPSAT